MKKYQVVRRRNGLSKPALLFALSILLVAGLCFFALKLRPDARRGNATGTPVRVYCASGVARPVEKIVAIYNETFNANIEIARTGGSGELAGQIKTEFETAIKRGADMVISADAGLLETAHEEGVIAERFPLAVQRPVIAVAADWPRSISGLRELLDRARSEDEQLKFGIASERAAVGRLTRRIAEADGLLGKLESGKATDSENVMTLAQSLVTGGLDAAIVWDTTVAQINSESGEPVLKIAVRLADAKTVDTEVQGDAGFQGSIGFQSNIAIGVVASSENASAALKFARFLTAPETGKQEFDSFGFEFIEGDPWEEVPEIHLYCGSMFTPVLERSVREFAAREGVNIYPRWEGCGKLVASMKSIRDDELFPDAYLACDRMFLDDVRDRFREPTTVSNNRIVMAVRADLDMTEFADGELGNPSHFPGMLVAGSPLRVGICDPTQSALGRLTKIMLSEEPFEGVYERLENDAAVSVDVGPTLISQLLAGGLDVAFVYRSDVIAAQNSEPVQSGLRIVEIDGATENSLAVQPWAVSRSTRNPRLMDRFFETVICPENRERFVQNGFETPDSLRE